MHVLSHSHWGQGGGGGPLKFSGESSKKKREPPDFRSPEVGIFVVQYNKHKYQTLY